MRGCVQNQICLVDIMIFQGMASALRWPNALRRRLANAEQSVSEHKQLQESINIV